MLLLTENSQSLTEKSISENDCHLNSTYMNKMHHFETDPSCVYDKINLPCCVKLLKIRSKRIRGLQMISDSYTARFRCIYMTCFILFLE
jgi:hypothetical protein